MEKKLETYLQTVESELGEMREARREGELREMRQHLEAIVARLTEGGLSEEEAVEAAIAQFGVARQVGRELEKVGTRKESLLRILLAPIGAAACAMILSSATVTLQEVIASVTMPWTQYLVLFFVTIWPIFLAAGLVAGFISPKWGGRLSIGLLSAYFLATNPVLMFGSISDADVSVLVILLSGCSGIFVGSRLASRFAQRKTQRQQA